MGSLFERPFIDEIKRDTEKQFYAPEVRTAFEEEEEEVEEEAIDDEISEYIEQVFRVLGTKAGVLEEEAISLQERQIADLDTDLIGAPLSVIEALNSIVDSPVPFNNRPPTQEELDRGINYKTNFREYLDCVACVAGLYGSRVPDNQLSTKIEELKASNDQVDAFRNATQKLGPKVTGWWIFMFMVRFILAYAVHVTLGFLCCFLRDKLVFKVLSYKIKIGEKLAGLVGDLEARLKGMLGFPCSRPEDRRCLEPGQTPTENQLRIFKCCRPRWESCGSSEGEPRLSLPDAFRCITEQLRSLPSFVTSGTFPSSKPCPGGDCRSRIIRPEDQAAGRMVMDYVIARNQGRYLSGRMSTNPSAIRNTATVIDTARTSRQLVSEVGPSFTGAWKMEYTYQMDPDRKKRCGLAKVRGLGAAAGLDNWQKMTRDDFKNALASLVDTDFTTELQQALREGTTLIVDGKNPPDIEPFKSFFEVLNTIDETLGAILDELRKYVVATKSLTGLLTDKEFCCVVYSIVLIANLARYQSLCPNEDLEKLFDYAKRFGDDRDVKGIIRFLELLREVIDALNAELMQSAEVIGLTLPLGTMLELLKRALAQTLIALFSIAIYPLEKILSQLSNNPKLRNLIDNNCFGVGALFDMFRCAIRWIMDYLRKLVQDMIPFRLKNQELLPNLRINGFQMAFLLKLRSLLDMIINLLSNIKDCYPDEKVPDAILNALPDVPVADGYSIGRTGDFVYYDGNRIPFEDIGRPVYLPDGTQVYGNTMAEVIAEYRESTIDPTKYETGGFPIYSEANRLGFIRIIEARNGIAPRDVMYDPEAEAGLEYSEVPYTAYSGRVRSTEEIRESMYNMVRILGGVTR